LIRRIFRDFSIKNHTVYPYRIFVAELVYTCTENEIDIINLKFGEYEKEKF